MGNYDAIGPTLIGLALPVNDFSRGASKDDVVGLSYITGNQALNIKR
jgi:phosphate acetyltransferase